jgi:hypothetical protein
MCANAHRICKYLVTVVAVYIGSKIINLFNYVRYNKLAIIREVKLKN